MRALRRWLVAVLVVSALASGTAVAQEAPPTTDPSTAPDPAPPDPGGVGVSADDLSRGMTGSAPVMSTAPGFSAPASGWQPPSWPTGTADVPVTSTGGAMAAGSLPVSLVVPAGTFGKPAVAHISMLDPSAAARVSTLGMAFSVRFGDASSDATVTPAAPVGLTVDFGPVANAGGTLPDRLQLVSVPACVLAGTASNACSGVVAKQANKDLPAHVLTATATPAEVAAPWAPSAKAAASDPKSGPAPGSVSPTAGGGTYALTSGASGSAGNYGATPVSTQATSQVGLYAGTFDTAYKFVIPPTIAGPQPELSLSYSSGAVDGMTGDRNTQASQIGLGWNFDVGSVTQDFAPCVNHVEAPGDLC
jgi:hypothetical protein